ncbi:MAG: hypothetical protein ACK4K0_03990 [Flavobacteriales bacterium]
MRTIKFLSILSFALLLVSCGNYVNEPLDEVEVEFMFEGPIFDGPNETSVSISFNPEANGVERERIKGLSITSIELSSSSEDGFDKFQSIAMLLVAEGIDMKNIAVINPVEKGKSTLVLNVSNEVEFEKVANLKTLNLVMDANLRLEEEYTDDDISITGKVKMAVRAKEKK